uniref:Uncharacterized protein n=1 Tax=Cacopsylla melanoneura TaxID=428564 RepID=A0A8D8VXA9_9HEMI
MSLFNQVHVDFYSYLQALHIFTFYYIFFLLGKMFNSFLSFSIQIHIMYLLKFFDFRFTFKWCTSCYPPHFTTFKFICSLSKTETEMFPGIFKTLCICILSIDALMLVEYTIPTYLTTSTFLLERRRYIKYLIVNFIFIIYLIFIRLVPLK